MLEAGIKLAEAKIDTEATKKINKPRLAQPQSRDREQALLHNLFCCIGATKGWAKRVVSPDTATGLEVGCIAGAEPADHDEPGVITR